MRFIPRSLLKDIIISLFVTFVLLELVAQIIRPESYLPDLYSNDRSMLQHEYDSELGWIPRSSIEHPFQLNRLTTIKTNAFGMRDKEWVDSDQPTIAFIGDSFVWGADVEASERFTDLIQSRMPGLQFRNLGVSGYGTDQTYLLLQRYWDTIKPDLVVLMYVGTNDRINNSSVFQNFVFKPYFLNSAQGLQLQGVPVPQSLHFSILAASGWVRAPYHYSYTLRAATRLYLEYVQVPRITIPDPTFVLLQELRDYVKKKGSVFLLAYESIDAELLDQLKRDQFILVNAITTLRYPNFGNHWTAEGHRQVAEIVQPEISRALSKYGYEF